MKRQRGLSQLLLVGALFIVAAVLWRDQLLLIRSRALAEQAQAAAAAVPSGPRAVPTWRAATDAEKSSAAASVDAQLEAFRKDDYAKAATYQSVALREEFPSLDTFRHMMKLNYPDFADCERIEYGDALADQKGERVRLAVKVTGRGGTTVEATYFLVVEDDEYRIEMVEGGQRPQVEPEGIL